LHGLGADGNDFAPIVPQLKLPSELGIRFIFPHAPQIPITINGGYVMPGWYDILNMDIEREINHQQFEASINQVRKLIEHEISQGIPSENILVLGFSQGGAVAYHTALGFEQPLAGVAGLSTYFVSQHDLEPSVANINIPMLICHGTQDGVVPLSLSEKAKNLMEKMGYQPEYKTYHMEHQVCMEEIRDIGHWIIQCLSKK
ncbi:MAG: dienelactone hydrolase family protein, partial [Pseudomonadota bacterium]